MDLNGFSQVNRLGYVKFFAGKSLIQNNYFAGKA